MEFILLTLAFFAFIYLALRFIMAAFSRQLYYSCCNVFDKRIFERIKRIKKYDHRNAIVLPKKDFRRMGPWLRDGALVEVEFHHPHLGTLKATAHAFYYSNSLRYLQDVGLCMNLRRYFGIEVIENRGSDSMDSDNPIKQKSYWRPAPFVSVRWFKRPRSFHESEIQYKYSHPNRRNYIREYIGVSLKITPLTRFFPLF